MSLFVYSLQSFIFKISVLGVIYIIIKVINSGGL